MSDRENDRPEEIVETDDGTAIVRDAEDVEADDEVGDGVESDRAGDSDEVDEVDEPDDADDARDADEPRYADDSDDTDEEPADDELAEVLENEAELREESEEDEPDADQDADSPDDGETDALVSRLRLIGEQPLTERAASLGQLHDELRARLESGDPSRR